MKNKFLFILTNPLFLSLILTLILLITLPPLFSKYKIELLKKEKNASLRFNQYCDLNNDGYSEEIVITKSYKSRTNILVSEKGKVINQWNFTGNLSMPKLFFGDFNNDGLKEIFLFTAIFSGVWFSSDFMQGWRIKSRFSCLKLQERLQRRMQNIFWKG